MARQRAVKSAAQRKWGAATKEEPAVVIRQAIRAGLPVVANRFAAPRPEGYLTRMVRFVVLSCDSAEA